MVDCKSVQKSEKTIKLNKSYKILSDIKYFVQQNENTAIIEQCRKNF